MKGYNMFLLRNKKILSLNYPRYPFLSGALLQEGRVPIAHATELVTLKFLMHVKEKPLENKWTCICYCTGGKCCLWNVIKV